MDAAVIIPARFASHRFPGKPLEPITGATGEARSLIRRSWEAAQRVTGISKIIIATDDARIRDHALSFGAEVAMTPASCANGTERCAAALDTLGAEPEIVVNLQGDAPLTPPETITAIVEGLRLDPEADMATPVLRCSPQARAGLLADRKAGRVGGTTAVMNKDGHALYFSKEVIPFGGLGRHTGDPAPVFHHMGVYAYRPATLRAYRNWPMGPLEQSEGLEQLRFLEQGRNIACIEIDDSALRFWEVNNPEDIPIIESHLNALGMA